jgi:hypothetical protein
MVRVDDEQTELDGLLKILRVSFAMYGTFQVRRLENLEVRFTAKTLRFMDKIGEL